jgi:hypothetical protein
MELHEGNPDKHEMYPDDLPTEDEILAVAEKSGYLGKYKKFPERYRARLMKLALEYRKELGQDVPGVELDSDVDVLPTAQRLADFYDELVSVFRAKLTDRMCAEILGAATGALITQAGLQLDSEGTAHHDDNEEQDQAGEPFGRGGFRGPAGGLETNDSGRPIRVFKRTDPEVIDGIRGKRHGG